MTIFSQKSIKKALFAFLCCFIAFICHFFGQEHENGMKLHSDDHSTSKGLDVHSTTPTSFAMGFTHATVDSSRL